MALGTPVLVQTVGPQTAAAPTSASFTPNANDLIIVVGAVTGTAAANGSISVSSTHTGIGSWTTTSAFTSTATTSSGVLAWALAGASPSSGTVTVTFSAGGVDNRFSIITISGVDTTTPVVGTVSNNNFTTATPSLTVSSTPTTADMLFGTFNNRNVTSDATVGSGFTAVVNSHNASSPSAGLFAEYKTGVTSTTVDAGNTGTVRHTGIAIVVQAAAGLTPISLTDTASGVDSINETSSGPLSDLGTGSDGISATAGLSVPEVASGVDSLAVLASSALSDPRTVADALATSATVPLSDTGSGADSLSVDAGSTPKALTDTATGVDSLLVVVTVPLVDASAAAVEVIGATVALALSDPRSVVDTFAIAASVALTDAGSSADAISLQVAASLADPRPIVDALGVVAGISLADTRPAAADLMTKTIAGQGISLADVAAALDELGVSVTVLEVQVAHMIGGVAATQHMSGRATPTSTASGSIGTTGGMQGSPGPAPQMRGS